MKWLAALALLIATMGFLAISKELMDRKWDNNDIKADALGVLGGIGFFMAVKL